MFNAAAFVLTLALISSLVGQAIDPPAEPEFTLRIASQLVVLNVAVQDVHGREITGLKAEDFKVYEDGHPQTVKQFAAEDRPVTVGIVLDASGSMRNGAGRSGYGSVSVCAFEQSLTGAQKSTPKLGGANF